MRQPTPAAADMLHRGDEGPAPSIASRNSTTKAVNWRCRRSVVRSPTDLAKNIAYTALLVTAYAEEVARARTLRESTRERVPLLWARTQ